MGKRGPRPKGKVNIRWSPDFAYAIGLLATDGSLSKNGRHISFVSKDMEQISNFMKCLNVEVHIGKTFSGYDGNSAYRVQFSDVLFYRFLNSNGLLNNKSKTIGEIAIPHELFFHFLRGCFDGDGTIYSYWDKRWKSSFMFYVSFVTASPLFMEWLRREMRERIGVSGHVKRDKRASTQQLTYAKSESRKILAEIYKDADATSLSRKRLKSERILCIMSERDKLKGEILTE
ncbi:MAG: LAGLIDADG family homing endonuclease [Candidatus Paceibacterota bacterium]|jgi:hypothetical protein